MSKRIHSVNPFSNKTIASYVLQNDQQIESILELSSNVFTNWQLVSLKNRVRLLDDLAKIMSDNLEVYSQLMTNEMGKPISQSRAEIKKCILLCDFYYKNAAKFLADALIETEAEESFISYDPIGTILAVMPWNYPFWQVMRFAVPTLTAGNTVLLKHASNVTGCAKILEDLFEKAGYPKGCFQTLLVNHTSIERIIGDTRVKAVSLTGSEKAGKKIAEIAGSHLKKCVLELGGNNACVILADADLDRYIDVMVNARMQNTGQSCIAAKRFIVEASIYDKFLKQFTERVKKLKIGDPIENDTEISVLARPDLAETLKKQVADSVAKGAKIHSGNKQDNAYYEPTIIIDVTPGMPIFDEETFGPVAAIIKVVNKEEAYKMVAKTRFGLGTMLFTKDTDDAKKHIPQIGDGAFFINELVKSDPRLPFGGTRASGYGRELSKEGILEFVNQKTVYIK